MELTINNLIKIIIAVLVITVLILGIYSGFKSYIIPYFGGFGFGEENENNQIESSTDICDKKTELGYIENNIIWIKKGDKYEKTDIYIKNGEIKKDVLFRDPAIGRINGLEIEIYNDHNTGNAKNINQALIGGLQICK